VANIVQTIGIVVTKPVQRVPAALHQKLKTMLEWNE